MIKNERTVVYTKKYYAANSEPMFHFIEKVNGLENISKDNRIREYVISDNKSITIKDANIFLSDKNNAVGASGNGTGAYEPVIVYHGRVIGEEKLLAFILDNK
jgi:hypothetical protein